VGVEALGGRRQCFGGVLELDADLVTSHWHPSNGKGLFPQGIFVFAPHTYEPRYGLSEIRPLAT